MAKGACLTEKVCCYSHVTFVNGDQQKYQNVVKLNDQINLKNEESKKKIKDRECFIFKMKNVSSDQFAKV